MSSLPVIVGLILALGGPPLRAAYGERVFHTSSPLKSGLLGEAALVGLCLAVLLLGVFWEGQPLSSLGVQPLRWQSFVLGLGLAGFFIFVFSPLAMRLPGWLGLAGFEKGLAQLAELPLWYTVLAVVLGGTIEEILYRGYAVPRLGFLSGSLWLGGLLSVLAFGLAHVPLWGLGPALTTLLSGGIATLFYIWQKDLLALVLAHVLTDSVGIVLMPRLYRKPGAPLS